MVQPGHADDCAACTYSSLPAEDKDVLDESAFTNHKRIEPEPEPERPRGPAPAVMCAGILLMIALGQSVGMVLGLVMTFGGLLWWYSSMSEWQRDQQEWAIEHEEWKNVQTQVWLQERAKGAAVAVPDLWQTIMFEPTFGHRDRDQSHRPGPLRSQVADGSALTAVWILGLRYTYLDRLRSRSDAGPLESGLGVDGSTDTDHDHRGS